VERNEREDIKSNAMMSDPKVTVLMAVYNAADYLNESIDSLLRQTMVEPFQIVCVDDGSTDTSLSILHDYERKDRRIEVIHLDKNSGQAHARNVGLKQARGQYICMLDADDWFSDDALQKAVEVMESRDDMDSVLFEVSNEWPSHAEIYALPPFVTLTGDEAFRMSLTWKIHGLYMVRASIHQLYPYDETCLLYSDDNTTRVHYLSSRVVGRCTGIYHYRQHQSSATHSLSVRRFDYLRANESMKRQLVEAHVTEDVIKIYENHRWLNLIDVYMFYFVHGHQLKRSERLYGRGELHRVWKNIDRSLLSKNAIHKFGYMPMPVWWLFRVQEWVYFSLRGLLGRNN
jgi:glycosyltransferase involved in cell wall biosynthesis